MRPLIIGEAPSKNETTERPLEGRVGRRLADLCGMTLEGYLAFFDRINLLHVRQDTKEKGFEFDVAAAEREAARLRNSELLFQARVVILLGKRVSMAFGVPTDYFERWWIVEAEAYAFPHPSGVNRWWNDHANVDRASRFLRAVVERARA